LPLKPRFQRGKPNFGCDHGQRRKPLWNDGARRCAEPERAPCSRSTDESGEASGLLAGISFSSSDRSTKSYAQSVSDRSWAASSRSTKASVTMFALVRRRGVSDQAPLGLRMPCLELLMLTDIRTAPGSPQGRTR
jgi:hypothetical protein